MPYSYVGASALGYDLTRLPHGAEAAFVLRTGLHARPADIATLAARHPGVARAVRWGRVAALPDTRPSTATPTPGRPAWVSGVERGGPGALAVREMASTLLGTPTALDLLVRHTVLDWTWIDGGGTSVQDPDATLAADVLVDAATAAFGSSWLPSATRLELAAPFRRARLSVAGDAATPHPTGHPAVDAILHRVLTLDAQGRQAWRDTVAARRAPAADWAPAMHQATLALHVTGRLRTSLDAHLGAVTAAITAGITADDASQGVWNALSGVLQGSLASDLLDEPQRDVLLAPWREIYSEDPVGHRP